MAQLHGGEDLFSALLAVSLLAAFTCSLGGFYRAQARFNHQQEFSALALDLVQSTKLQLTDPSGCLDWRPFGAMELPEYSGVNVRLELRVGGKPLASWGQGLGPVQELLSPPCVIDLPVVVKLSPSSRALGKLVVWVWG